MAAISVMFPMASNADLLEEVVVTATKRAQNLKEIPIRLNPAALMVTRISHVRLA